MADATSLVTALRDVASKVDALTEEVRKEQVRCETGWKWKRDHDNRNWAEKEGYSEGGFEGVECECGGDGLFECVQGAAVVGAGGFSRP